MSNYLYAVGEMVTYGFPSGTFSGRTAKHFTILAQLPPLGDDLQYRIKSLSEAHERVVVEHQLSSNHQDPEAPSAEANANAVFTKS